MGSTAVTKSMTQVSLKDGDDIGNKERQKQIFESNNQLQDTEMKLKDAQMRRL